MRTFVRCFFVLLLALFVQASAFAQSNSGTISGAVTDPSGAVVPGATVSIEKTQSASIRVARPRTAKVVFNSRMFPSIPTI